MAPRPRAAKKNHPANRRRRLWSRIRSRRNSRVPPGSRRTVPGPQRRTPMIQSSACQGASISRSSEASFDSFSPTDGRPFRATTKGYASTTRASATSSTPSNATTAKSAHTTPGSASTARDFRASFGGFNHRKAPAIPAYAFPSPASRPSTHDWSSRQLGKPYHQRTTTSWTSLSRKQRTALGLSTPCLPQRNPRQSRLFKRRRSRMRLLSFPRISIPDGVERSSRSTLKTPTPLGTSVRALARSSRRFLKSRLLMMPCLPRSRTRSAPNVETQRAVARYRSWPCTRGYK